MEGKETNDMSEDTLPIGTRVRFNRTLTEPPGEDHPGRLYAEAGEEGEVTGHGCAEGYWVKTARNPPFGASRSEFEVLPDAPRVERKAKWTGTGRHCQTGRPDLCLAGHFDGVTCGIEECDIAAGNRKPKNEPQPAKEKAKRNVKPNRQRKARWRGYLGAVLYQFEYSPTEGVIRIWRHRHHRKRIITMTDLLHALEGQKLLPL